MEPQKYFSNAIWSMTQREREQSAGARRVGPANPHFASTSVDSRHRSQDVMRLYGKIEGARTVAARQESIALCVEAACHPMRNQASVSGENHDLSLEQLRVDLRADQQHILGPNRRQHAASRYPQPNLAPCAQTIRDYLATDPIELRLPGSGRLIAAQENLTTRVQIP
ncbi:MAG: hypothetical protein WB498_07670 [Candidatus Binatus sp.]